MSLPETLYFLFGAIARFEEERSRGGLIVTGLQRPPFLSNTLTRGYNDSKMPLESGLRPFALQMAGQVANKRIDVGLPRI
jgi:hypothetical protein